MVSVEKEPVFATRPARRSRRISVNRRTRPAFPPTPAPVRATHTETTEPETFTVGFSTVTVAFTDTAANPPYGIICANNPVCFRDPFGLTSQWAFWDPESAVGRQFVSIGDAFGSTLARPFFPEGAANVWNRSVNNSGQAVLNETCPKSKTANNLYWGAIGVGFAADGAAAWMIGTEALAANGYYNVANSVANRAASPFLKNEGSRWFSEMQAEALMNGPRLANTGQGLRNLLTTFRYASPGNGEVVLNWMTRTIVHANPFF